MVYGVA
jgi:Niemann-Pick C1 protein